MADKESVIHDSGSVFHSLGLPDADDLQLRAQLLMTIGQVIAERGLKQREAGALMGMEQPRVSALIKGDINKFSTDRLIRALCDLGRDIEVRILPAQGEKGQLRVAA